MGGVAGEFVHRALDSNEGRYVVLLGTLGLFVIPYLRDLLWTSWRERRRDDDAGDTSPPSSG